MKFNYRDSSYYEHVIEQVNLKNGDIVFKFPVNFNYDVMRHRNYNGVFEERIPADYGLSRIQKVNGRYQVVAFKL